MATVYTLFFSVLKYITNMLIVFNKKHTIHAVCMKIVVSTVYAVNIVREKWHFDDLRISVDWICRRMVLDMFLGVGLKTYSALLTLIHIGSRRRRKQEI